MAALVLAVAAPGAADADALEEFRFGVMAHNTCLSVLTCDNAHKESGVNLAGEVVFASPALLRWALAPRPYVMASVNISGDTSYAGGGLAWSWRFAEGWALEPGLGYVVHSGEDLDNPYPPGDPSRGPFQETKLLLGSRDVFRLSLVLDRDLTESWGVQLAAEHLSHGQILGDGRNQGVDELGVRLRYRFGD
jgi:hypothetical protein